MSLTDKQKENDLYALHNDLSLSVFSTYATLHINLWSIKLAFNNLYLKAKNESID